MITTASYLAARCFRGGAMTASWEPRSPKALHQTTPELADQRLAPTSLLAKPCRSEVARRFEPGVASGLLYEDHVASDL